ncbi:MAG: prolipoprotein diacylglyceryl transferase [Neomegalonema sp.]|nr:prolipoprotein diacylglyceryl transferase [Neomegalonema sp.]
MPFAIPFPFDHDSRVIFEIGPFALRWYAVAYMVGLIAGWLYVARLMRRETLWQGAKAPMPADQTDLLLIWMAFGVVLGGRLGFVIFYEPGLLWPNPLQALKIWQGGMAFHGGMLGVIIAVLIIAKMRNESPLSIGDAIACATPIGLFFGRIANFINGELWGRPTDLPWGMVFPQVVERPLSADGTPLQSYADRFPDLLVDGVNVARHPSQLYEAILEGLVLFLILGWMAWRGGALKRPGMCVGVFLIGYGVARFAVEFVRQYDPSSGFFGNGFDFYLFGAGITRGQTLCIPMLIAGAAFIYYARRRARAATSSA